MKVIHRRALFVLAGLWVLAGAAWGQAEARPEFRPLFRESWGGIYCTGDVKSVPDATGRRHLLSTPAGPVTVIHHEDRYILQFPRHTANIDRLLDGSVRIRYGPETYTFGISKTEFVAKVPGDTVRYTLTYGRLTGIRGRLGTTSIRSNLKLKTYNITSACGRSKLTMENDQLVLTEGPELASHQYLVRGFRFEDAEAGIGIYVRIPGGALTDALPWSACLVVRPPAAWQPPVVAPREPDPLDAVLGPRGEDDPLRAMVGPGGDQDPLRATENPEGAPDPLKANRGDGKVLRAREETPDQLEDPLKARLGDPAQDPLMV
ncbi:MAG: hypothetical protein AB1758_37505, partial [Candidatus Eremiobacterota bacterium]